MKKQILSMLILLFSSSLLFSQGAFNTDGSQADASAGLEVKFTNKGFLPPRIALTAINAASPVTSPAIGLLVYNTATSGTSPNNVIPGFYYWNGTRWIAINLPTGSSAGDMIYWNGTQWEKVPVGTSGQVLKLNGTVPAWGQSATTAPIVQTKGAYNISSVSVLSGGNVTDGGAPVTARGVCWGLTVNPTVAGSKTSDGIGSGAYTSTITGLTANTLYHVRAYASNSVGTSYGSDSTFTTINIVTAAATAITQTTATCSGTVASDGGNTILSRGVCWNTMTAPTTANFWCSPGTGGIGTFTCNLSGLSGNTLYYARAFIINSSGTFYGNEVTFLTSPVVPVILTTAITALTQTTASSGGTIANDGGCAITARGVCWNTSTNPTIANSKTMDGSGAGAFSSSIIGLSQYTTYYVRAYATNCAGTTYGNNVSFITNGTLPTVVTTEVTGVTLTTAIAVGNVTAAGTPGLTERGICWHWSNTNPTIDNVKIPSGSGTGSYNVIIPGLTPNLTCYARAYAISNYGVAYGTSVQFTTPSAYYTGFESGLPAGWTGTWTVSTDSPFHGYYCLKSVNPGETIQFTKTITTASGGQITWYHKGDDGHPFASVKTQFYIDNTLSIEAGDEGWTVKTAALTPGAHTFKWVNGGGGNYNNINYIDYIIISD